MLLQRLLLLLLREAAQDRAMGKIVFNCYLGVCGCVWVCVACISIHVLWITICVYAQIVYTHTHRHTGLLMATLLGESNPW